MQKAPKPRSRKKVAKAPEPLAPPPHPDPERLARNKKLLLAILDRIQKNGLGPYLVQWLSGGSTRVQ